MLLSRANSCFAIHSSYWFAVTSDAIFHIGTLFPDGGIEIVHLLLGSSVNCPVKLTVQLKNGRVSAEPARVVESRLS